MCTATPRSLDRGVALGVPLLAGQNRRLGAELDDGATWLMSIGLQQPVQQRRERHPPPSAEREAWESSQGAVGNGGPIDRQCSVGGASACRAGRMCGRSPSSFAAPVQRVLHRGDWEAERMRPLTVLHVVDNAGGRAA